MSLTASLNIALSGLQSAQSAMTLTSNNLAGVNDPNYVRKSVAFESNTTGGVSNGVTLSEIRRDFDRLLQKDYRQEVAKQKHLEVMSQYHSKIESLYGSIANKNALSDLITRLRQKMESLSASPEVSANQFNAVSAANEVANRFRDMSRTVSAERNRADRQLDSAMFTINQQLQIIAETNQKITGLQALKKDATGLRDKRDAAIDKLATYLDIHYFESANGQITVGTKSGENLVTGHIAGRLSFEATPLVNQLVTYPDGLSGITVNINGAVTDITARLNKGELAALFNLRDTTLPTISKQLDQLANRMLIDLNRIHNRGANTPLGRGVTLADDPTQTSNRFFADPTDIMRLDHPVDLVLLDTNGKRIDPPPAVTTIAAGSYRINDIARRISDHLGARGSVIFNNDNAIEIRLERGVRLAIADRGTSATGGDATITFGRDQNGQPHRYNGFSNFFGFNNLFTSVDTATGLSLAENQGGPIGAADNFTVRQDLQKDPTAISRGRLSGTAPDYALGKGDNRLALELAAAFDQNHTFDPVANGPGQVAGNFAGYAANMLSHQATVTATNQSALDFQNTLTESVKNRFRSQTGVNLDEELSNMMVFQNSYNSSARVIKATKEMFDELLRLV